MASLRLLEAGFAASGHEIPAELGGQAWAIIENAAADPEPEPEPRRRPTRRGGSLARSPWTTSGPRR